MSEMEPGLRLEIAHVLFIDMVGSSKLLTNEQSELLRILNQVVRETDQVRATEAAGKLIRLPTGTGWHSPFLQRRMRPFAVPWKSVAPLRVIRTCGAHGSAQRPGR